LNYSKFVFVICIFQFVIDKVMRVISGRYKGRRLKGPEGSELRPTGDRLKESLFNILSPDIAGAVLLDAFGGTGSIGIEALSRGAREAVFIDNSAAGCRLIRKNLELCGIQSGYRIIQQDIFASMRALARQEFKTHIAFLDPPYDWKPYADLLKIVFTRDLLLGPCCVVIEHHRKASLPESGDGYRRYRMVRQGDHCLSFYAVARSQ
jgi:16S rRNA (guanine(966)-N(2))-methyltransferase RsmD